MSTPDQTMRELAAVAMFARRDDPYDDREWAELDRADQEFWYCYADAALTAIATPTPAMVEAGAREAHAYMAGDDWFDCGAQCREQERTSFRRSWAAALTAAGEVRG